ncbi:hypothetical protein [Amycolatopsis sp. NPDC051128]|uniref:hypothetical protein n=1 Tax=Amycolatopsis sp. NPDC051128 TaxID=3155412 RepID=UPI00342FB2E3
MAVGVVVVLGAAVGAFVFLNRGNGETGGKYGAAPLPTCDEVAIRVGNLPPKSSGTKIGQGWVCHFANSADAVTVDLDLEVSTVRQQRTGVDVYTSSGGYVPDPAVHLGESAAWGPSPTGKLCTLAVWDSNAQFKVGVSDGKLAADDTQSCRNRVMAIAQVFYDSTQPQ